MHKRLVYAAFAVTLCLVGHSARPDFLYQPPPVDPSSMDKQWREAGSGLFNGIARLNEALGALELKDGNRAEQRLKEADMLLSAAADTYIKVIVPAVEKNPRKVSISKLPVTGRSRVEAAFKEFEVREPPTDEKQAADLAGKETAALLSWTRAQRQQILKSDLQTVHVLIRKISRLQNVGAATAELMTAR